MTAVHEDLDYLSARIHGRRSRIADAERLDALCRLRSLDELARAVLPEGEPPGVREFQKRLALGWLKEMEALALGLSPPRRGMIEALVDRLRVEDQKLLVRGMAAGHSLESLQSHFLRPIENTSASLETFSSLLPRHKRAATPPPHPFLLESALDHGYFQGLLAALRGLDAEDQSRIRPLVFQEVDHFHLMVIVRGRFFHGLEAEHLRPWHLDGTKITPRLFERMLLAPGLLPAVSLAAGLALDALPNDEGSLAESLAWSRFARLARRAFRQGAMDFGTLVAYSALRRLEVANLITLSEGIRLGLPGEGIRARMLPRSQEAA